MIYKRVACPKCGQLVAENWLVRHLKAEHPLPPPFDVDELDPECRALVLAMNEFPGIRTISSCSGHGERRYLIGFTADSLEVLPLLLYHCIGNGWRVYAVTDGAISPVTFALEGPVGAFSDAEKMAAKMWEYLEDADVP